MLRVVVAFAAIAGCSRARADPVPVPAAPPAEEPAPASAAPTATAPPFSTRAYRMVLHTGDSMVGGGLCRALAPRFAAEGSRFIRDVWENGSIEDFAASDRLPHLLDTRDPDLVLLTLGANDVGGVVTEYLAKRIEKVAAMTQRHHARDCIWIGPPKWRVDGKPVVDMIRAHSAPCVFFDSTDVEMQRKPDKIHPDEKGGDQWAVAFWHFFRGPGADAGTFDVYAGVLR